MESPKIKLEVKALIIGLLIFMVWLIIGILKGYNFADGLIDVISGF